MTTVGIDKEIAQTVSRIDELGHKLASAKQRLYDLRCQLTGIHIGDIVQGMNGKLYRVTHIDFGFPKAWVAGNPQLKDGAFGTSVRHLYGDWEKVK